MRTDVLIVVLLAAVLHAGWNALLRASSHNARDACLLVIGAAAWMALILPFLPPPRGECWLFLIISTVLHVLYFLLLASGYRVGKLSFCYPLMRGTAPVLAALAAVCLLKEQIAPGGWLGIAAICGGILLLSGDAWKNGSLQGSAVRFSLLNGVVIAAYTFVDGQGVRLSGQAFSYTGWLFVLTAAVLICGWLITGERSDWRQTPATWLRALFGGACSVAAYGLVLWAMTQAPIGLVAAMRESSVAIAALIGFCFLREKVTLLGLLSICMVTAGAAVMRIW